MLHSRADTRIRVRRDTSTNVSPTAGRWRGLGGANTHSKQRARPTSATPVTSVTAQPERRAGSVRKAFACGEMDADEEERRRERMEGFGLKPKQITASDIIIPERCERSASKDHNPEVTGPPAGADNTYSSAEHNGARHQGVGKRKNEDAAAVSSTPSLPSQAFVQSDAPATSLPASRTRRRSMPTSTKPRLSFHLIKHG